MAVTAIVGAGFLLPMCTPPVQIAPLERHPVLDTLGIPPLDDVRLSRVFTTGFENDSDLAGFDVTPQSAMTRHETRWRRCAQRCPRDVGWLTGVTGIEPVDGPNHRGYPMIQLQRRPVATCATPCLVEFWARLDDVELRPRRVVQLRHVLL